MVRLRAASALDGSRFGKSPTATEDSNPRRNVQLERNAASSRLFTSSLLSFKKEGKSFAAAANASKTEAEMTNPIESTFATVRLRTVKSRGCGSRTSILSTVFKLAQSAEQRWQKLHGAEMITKVITGVQFRNGVEVLKKDRQKIAA